MESFVKEKKVYMIGCGDLKDICKIYRMKTKGKYVEIYNDNKHVATYTKEDMRKFLSVGFAMLV